MELITLNLAANQTQAFAKSGRYFEIIDAAFPVQIDFYGDGGNQTDSMRNALSGLFLEDPFTQFNVTNGSTAQAVTLLVMENGRGGSRRQPGNVRVIDQGADKTTAGNQFFMTAQAGAAAAKVSLQGVIAGSKPLFIKRLSIGAQTAQQLVLLTSSGPPTDTLGTSPLANKAFGLPSAMAVKSAGYATSNAPTMGELPGNAVLGRSPVAAAQMVEIPLTTPFRLPPSTCLYVCGSTVNNDVYMAADCEE